MVTGCPIGGCREKILKAVEDLGADVVAFDSCSGPRTQQVLVDETMDPFRALAEKYLMINCSVMTPNQGRFEDMQDMLSHYQVDGVIELVLHGCHTFAVEAYYTKKFVTETIDLPYVCIDADFSSSDAGQIRTRLAAFLEIVESRG
jgi:benzoyl-CoA reductase/2-hydroxyglutaryl-CoA dehydratase subunit BcrC/BadD/HgdB